MQLYLDLDGVLADFDALAGELCNTDNIHKFEFVFGPDAFWRRIDSDPFFFANLLPKEDAYELLNAVHQLNPIILTALPRAGAKTIEEQKRQWVADYVGDDTKVITCLAKDKPIYCKPGDVLVDDRNINRVEWEKRGGIFILHTGASDTINQLIAKGII